MLYEAVNVSAAEAALEDDFVDLRTVVSVSLNDVIHRFVIDTNPLQLTIGSDVWAYEAVPFAKIGTVFSGDGQAADTTSITLDGSLFHVEPPETPTAVLLALLNYDLKNRPIQIATMVLDPDTSDPLGILPDFVGFIDYSKYEETQQGVDVNGKVIINIGSYKGFVLSQPPQTYSDISHRKRYPGDFAFKWVSDTFFRNGKFSWNKEASTRTGGTYTPYNPYDPFNPYDRF